MKNNGFEVKYPDYFNVSEIKGYPVDVPEIGFDNQDKNYRFHINIYPDIERHLFISKNKKNISEKNIDNYVAQIYVPVDSKEKVISYVISSKNISITFRGDFKNNIMQLILSTFKFID